MTTFIKCLFLFATAGLSMFVLLPEAKAGGRMSMTMGRPQMMMTANTMAPLRNSTVPSGNMMNGNTTNGTMGNRHHHHHHDIWGFGFPGNRWPGYGLSAYVDGYGWGGLSPDLYAPTDDSQKSKSASRKRINQDETIPSLTPEQERERIHQQELAWSRGELSENQTSSATALNILLADLQGFQTRGIQGPDIQIDGAIIPSINVVRSGSNGNIGVLKHEGRINWPAPLSGTEFEVERQRIDSSLTKIIDESINGEPADLQGLTGTLASMRGRLTAKIKEIPAPEYIRAKRILNHLDDAVRILRQPDAPNYFNQTYAAKGQTVAQLVQYMAQFGLRFAPAVEGDEAAYMALHQALAEYDLAVNSRADGATRNRVITKN